MRDREPFVTRLTALDWHRLAVEKGNREAAAAWWREAIARGEVNSEARSPKGMRPQGLNHKGVGDNGKARTATKAEEGKADEVPRSDIRGTGGG